MLKTEDYQSIGRLGRNVRAFLEGMG